MQAAELLLNRIRNNVATSLMLTASLLLLKVDSIDAKEGQTELEEAHGRIRALAAVKKQLEPIPRDNGVVVAGYLTPLCESLTQLLLDEHDPITLRVNAGAVSVSPDTAVSLGIITSELVINCLKYAFPDKRTGNIFVTYHSDKFGWMLKIDDDGIGQSKEKLAGPRGLGTTLVNVFADKLNATVRTKSSLLGTKISIAHAFV